MGEYCKWSPGKGPCAGNDKYSHQDLIRLAMQCGVSPNGPSGFKKASQLCEEITERLQPTPEPVVTLQDRNHELWLVFDKPLVDQNLNFIPYTQPLQKRIASIPKGALKKKKSDPSQRGAGGDLGALYGWMIAEPADEVKAPTVQFDTTALDFCAKVKQFSKRVAQNLLSQSPVKNKSANLQVLQHFVVAAMMLGKASFNAIVRNYHTLVSYFENIPFEKVLQVTDQVDQKMCNIIEREKVAYNFTPDKMLKTWSEALKPKAPYERLRLLKQELTMLESAAQIATPAGLEIVRQMAANIRKQIASEAEDVSQVESKGSGSVVPLDPSAEREAKQQPYCVTSFEANGEDLDVDDPEVISIINDRSHSYRRHCYKLSDLLQWFQTQNQIFEWSKAGRTWEPGAPILGQLYKLPLSGTWIRQATVDMLKERQQNVFFARPGPKRYLGALDHTMSAVWNRHEPIYELLGTDLDPDNVPFQQPANFGLPAPEENADGDDDAYEPEPTPPLEVILEHAGITQPVWNMLSEPAKAYLTRTFFESETPKGPIRSFSPGVGEDRLYEDLLITYRPVAVLTSPPEIRNELDNEARDLITFFHNSNHAERASYLARTGQWFHRAFPTWQRLRGAFALAMGLVVDGSNLDTLRFDQRLYIVAAARRDMDFVVYNNYHRDATRENWNVILVTDLKAMPGVEERLTAVERGEVTLQDEQYVTIWRKFRSVEIIL